MEMISKSKSFGGEQRVYRHKSTVTGTDMDFAVFLPREALDGFVCPALFFLSGLTCTWENVTTKGLPQLHAAKHGMIFIAPDTSPRGEKVADNESYAIGKGAGFYINATQDPWASHYKMEDYIANELRTLVIDALPVDEDAIGITGHSMGGHGALTLAMKYPGKFHSLSAFAPIVNPAAVPWGQTVFELYLGEDQEPWKQHDACMLVLAKGWDGDILIDQGTADQFLEEQLTPWAFEAACRKAGVDLTLRMQGGYDHSYHFVSSFLADHMAWHADRLD
jgi:S-formylglutathione hydrolase